MNIVIPEILPFRSDHTTAKQYRGSQYVEIPDIEQLDRIRDINHEAREEHEGRAYNSFKSIWIASNCSLENCLFLFIANVKEIFLFLPELG